MTMLLRAQGLALSLPTGRRLLEPCDLLLDRRRTVLVGANGVGKSSLCRALAGTDQPEAVGIRAAGSIMLADARSLPSNGPVSRWLPQAFQRLALLAEFGLDHIDPAKDIETLSGGERQRLALVRALAEPAALLILDEPGSHLDRGGREALLRRLQAWRGGLLIVSHQRELLGLAERVLELSQQRLHDYAMDFSSYVAERAREQTQAARELDTAKRQLRQQRDRAQQQRERSQARAGQGERARRRGSHGPMYFDFVAGRAEAGGGRRQRQAEARIGAASQSLDEARERLRLDADFDLRLPAAPLPAGKSIIRAQALRVEVPGRVLIESLDFELRGPQRVAVEGPNGSGKSLLLRTLAGLREPDAGSLFRAELATGFIDQQIGPQAPKRSLLEDFQISQPELPRAAAMQRLAWFGFVDEQLQQPVQSLSTGERVRLALACQLGGERVPLLLLLDEPDNHLDLHSLAIVEHALAQFRGALVVVSHSPAFLRAIGIEASIELGEAADCR